MAHWSDNDLSGSERELIRKTRPEKVELLPCPFCGAEAVLEEVENGVGPTGSVCFSVGCNSKDEEACMGYQSLTTFSRRSDAIAAWNRRA